MEMEFEETQKMVVGGEGKGAASSTDGSLWAHVTELEGVKVSVKEKMRRIRGFEVFVGKSEEVVQNLQKALGDTTLAERKQDMMLAPVEKYCAELRERHEEVRCDGWQKKVLELMRKRAVETVEQLYDECEKAGDENEERKEALEKENEKLKESNKYFQKFLEEKNVEMAEEMARSEAEKEQLQLKLEEAEKKIDKLKSAMAKEKKVSEGLKNSIAHLEGKCATAREDKEFAERRWEDGQRWMEFRKAKEEECGCKNGKGHFVDGFGGRSYDPKSLALRMMAKNEKINPEDVHLMVFDQEFQKKLGKAERFEALRRFAEICPTWAEKIMMGKMEESESEWKEVADSLKKDVLQKNQPKKATIKEKFILIGQKMNLKSRAVFEVRAATISTWKQKFEWDQVQKAVILVDWTKKEPELEGLKHMVEEIAKEVQEVVVVPSKMECGFDEVGGVTAEWRKTRKTAVNVEIVDPLSPVGSKKTPLILSELKTGSLERVVEYLELAVPRHPVVARLKEEVSEEPKAKKPRGQ